MVLNGSLNTSIQNENTSNVLKKTFLDKAVFVSNLIMNIKGYI